MFLIGLLIWAAFVGLIYWQYVQNQTAVPPVTSHGPGYSYEWEATSKFYEVFEKWEQKDESVSKQDVMNALMNRAIHVVQLSWKLQADYQSVNGGKKVNIIPTEVFDAYQDLTEETNGEIMDIKMDAERVNEGWSNDIFPQAVNFANQIKQQQEKAEREKEMALKQKHEAAAQATKQVFHSANNEAKNIMNSIFGKKKTAVKSPATQKVVAAASPAGAAKSPAVVKSPAKTPAKEEKAPAEGSVLSKRKKKQKQSAENPEDAVLEKKKADLAFKELMREEEQQARKKKGSKK